MISKKISDAIKIVAERMNGITWAVIGSGALALQGMDVKPNDLDISVNIADLETISKIFKDYAATNVKEIETMSGKRAWDVIAIIEGVETQFCGEAETDAEAIWFNRVHASKMVVVDVDGFRIPCISLSAASEAYAELHRPQKAELIQAFLHA